ncbi:MAG TPA: FliH/SctL family protein [Vicinamibacterales bacterium]|nr:FliH/SctL family protein [Vicinamibacterales bacterium]
MSFRARRLGAGASVEPFPWATLEDAGAVPGAAAPAGARPMPGRSPVPQSVAPAAPAAVEEARPPAAPAAPAIDQEQVQRRLAELEREAFAKGHAAGEQAGLEAGSTRADAMLRRLGRTLEEIDGLRAQIIAQTERQMVQIALAVAKRILHREVSIDQDLVVAIARVALDRLGETANATIRLNPDDCAALATRRGAEWAGSRVTVVPDAGVSRGGCRVESEFGFIDAGVDAQFEQLVHGLLGDGEAVPVPDGADGTLFADPVS